MDFIRVVEKSNIGIQRVLFGFYPKGAQNIWGDIDIALVSEDFEGSRYFDTDKLRDARFKIDTDISLADLTSVVGFPEPANPASCVAAEKTCFVPYTVILSLPVISTALASAVIRLPAPGPPWL